MLTYWNFIKFLFAFISEVILGKNTLRQAFKYDRRRVYVLILFIASLSINFFVVPRIVQLSYEHYLLRTEVQRLQLFILSLESQDPLPALTQGDLDLHPPDFTENSEVKHVKE